jgi:undecaprenyl-diphosphatase
MKDKAKSNLTCGIVLITLFVIWTVLIQTVDVRPVGVNNTDVGFATLNTWFHGLTGVNLTLYTVTDWLGLVPLFVCLMFGMIGFIQLVKRKSILKVDLDIVALGIYYVIVILFYLFFETTPINYRPILIEGFAEASYPSSTTLLVLSVMPTFVFQLSRRLNKTLLSKIAIILSVMFSLFMVVGRLISGVHWLTDIAGSILLSTGLFCIYKGAVLWNSTKNCRA